ncbi:DedA family protein [Telmatospirillum siberiense]|uniref:DedA family protein n=1 Tax=Telmatospirillum siberiense TaxID=382514 RepID=A0A2N3Q0W4_9PROT|nr:DedA family protein [Telmatospirillum siberiense]PKU26300.1 DedA family protein [Telmatospirillum siberiense]
MSLEQWIVDFANNYGPLIYLVILVWTFLEGETVVLVTGALISGGAVHLNVWLLALFAFLGSFGGDQAWFYIGRTYGTPLLKRWPNMARKVEFAFTLLRRQENLFILSFRFIYGLRNISPFIIGMTGVSRAKFFTLNLIAAVVWANAFAWGGYTLGKVLETYLGESSQAALAVLVAVILCVTVINWLRQRRKNRARDAAADAAAKVAEQETADGK